MNEQDWVWDERDEAMVPLTVFGRVRNWARSLSDHNDIITYGYTVVHPDGTVEQHPEVARH